MITYKTRQRHPGTVPSATIRMAGLCCLSFDNANKCTVGVNNLVGGGHTWKFLILDQESDTSKVVRKQGNVVIKQENYKDLREIHIDVKGGTTGGTYVYNGQNEVSLPQIKEQRFNLESYWVDLEGPRGHDRPVKNDAKTLWPRFYINEGLFCASKLSTGEYELKDNKPTPLIKSLGRIALEVVADIFLDDSPDSKIEIRLPDKTISLDNSKRHQIYITNDCDSLVPIQSDFHLHYNAFSNAFSGRRNGMMSRDERFHLIPDTSSATGNAESAVAQAGDNYSPFTDRAPCMNVVLGQTTAFNA